MFANWNKHANQFLWSKLIVAVFRPRCYYTINIKLKYFINLGNKVCAASLFNSVDNTWIWRTHLILSSYCWANNFETNERPGFFRILNLCFLSLIYAILKLYFLLCARISKDYKVRQPWEISTYILLYQSRHGLHDYGAKKRAEICLEMNKRNYVVRYMQRAESIAVN